MKLGGAALAVAATQTAQSYAKIVGANDRVRTGIIGGGDRMLGGDVPAFVANQKDMNFELVAVSDIWSHARERAAAAVEKACGSKIDMVPNNDALYARKDIDAVLIATADFQHARHGIEAVKAGRDAYVEKPTAHRMDDARNFLKAVEGSSQVIAVGTQRRSTPAYIKAAEYIQSGKFGDIVMVEMSWNVNQPGRWRRPDVVPLLKEEDTDWKRYCMGVIKTSSMRASILSSASSGPTPPVFPTSGSSTRSTPSTGSPACRTRARSSPTAASTCGRTAAPTGTP